MRISDWSSDVCSSDLWTIPVNQALAYCPTIDDEHFDASYTVYRVEDDGPLKGLRFLLSASLVQAFAQRAGATQFVAESAIRSDEHTSELQSLMRTSYAVLCLKRTHMSRTPFRPPNTTHKSTTPTLTQYHYIITKHQ